MCLPLTLCEALQVSEVLARGLRFLHHLEAEDISVRPLSNTSGSATVCSIR